MRQRFKVRGSVVGGSVDGISVHELASVCLFASMCMRVWMHLAVMGSSCGQASIRGQLLWH